MPGKRAEGAQYEPIPNLIVRAHGKYFAHVGAIADIIIAHGHPGRGVDRKRAAQTNVVAHVERVVISPRRFGMRVEAQVESDAGEDLLGAADLEWHFRV